MRAEDLDQAIALANGTPFGLTSGIQTLDDREIARWVDRIDAGTLYVNRPITGAIVGRQPFGGWKASSVGPGAKAGGPNYLLQLVRWRQITPPPGGGEPLPEALQALVERCLEAARDADERALLRASAESYARAWREHFSREHDPSPIVGERNGFRYRPCRRIVARAGAPSVALAQVALAARATGVPLTISLAPGSPVPRWVDQRSEARIVVETEMGFVERLAYPEDAERVRVWEPLAVAARAAANSAGLPVIDAPVVANGRLELRWYLREQTVSRMLHRYGSVAESRTE
jgi:RHH-type proline utilization regulon transcriptional repressor/proline dehydrogenase/delta 1-pyrroline-5-carboxylate dehydrogenase